MQQQCSIAVITAKWKRLAHRVTIWVSLLYCLHVFQMRFQQSADDWQARNSANVTHNPYVSGGGGNSSPEPNWTQIMSKPLITSRLVFTARLRPQVRMPAKRRAQLRVPNVPRSRISERALFWINEHAQCRVFGRTSLQRAYVIPCRQQMGSSAVLRARRSALVLAASTRACGGRIALDGVVASILALWR